MSDMNRISYTNRVNTTKHVNRANNGPDMRKQFSSPALPEPISSLFAQLNAQDVDQFYQSYQCWQREQQLGPLQARIAKLQQQVKDNAVLMQLAQPSALALATLTRLQSYGVDDINLLDRMLERGDTWLDHTMQLLEQCEQLGFIHDNYTEWCEHALEGAYDWIDSMNEDEAGPAHTLSPSAEAPPAASEPDVTFDEATEAILLQKLMSDDDTNDAHEVVPSVEPTIPTIDAGDTVVGQLPQSHHHEESVVDAIEVPQWEVETGEAEPSHDVSDASDASDAQAEENRSGRYKHPLRSLPWRVLARVWDR